MNGMLTDWKDWDNVDPKDFPIIIFGGDKAGYNETFDTRNKFVKLIKSNGTPAIFTLESIDGSLQINGCFPLFYRLATPIEVQRLINKDKEYFTEKDFTVILNKVELEVGMEVTLFPDNKGKIIKMEGYGHLEPIFKKEDYCVIELYKPDEHGNTIIEIQKSSFNYLTYPK